MIEERNNRLYKIIEYLEETEELTSDLSKGIENIQKANRYQASKLESEKIKKRMGLDSKCIAPSR